MRRALPSMLALLALAACTQPAPVVVSSPPQPASINTVLVPVPVGQTASVAGTPGLTVGRLTQSQVQALLSNNTVRGVDSSGRFYDAYLAAGGTFRMDRQGIAQNGTWRVLPDGQVCSILASNPTEQCYWLSHEGAYLRYERTDGTPVGAFVVLAGNPRGL
jgi:hypothetical protein